jgi:hypothetical protein
MHGSMRSNPVKALIALAAQRYSYRVSIYDFLFWNSKIKLINRSNFSIRSSVFELMREVN